MSYILNIETATHVCSVALSKDGVTLDLIENFEDKTHAELLTVFIEQILERNHIVSENLSAICVSEGPGSYTGLRIGISVAKGLCYGLKIPLISIPTLKAMAFGAEKIISDKEILCPMIDARRMEVYTTLYSSDLEIIENVHAKIIDSDSFSKILQTHTVLFFGTGSEKCKSTILNPNAQFIDKTFISASNMSYLGFEKFKNKEFEDVAYFEPFYLKEFQAIKSQKKYF